MSTTEEDYSANYTARDNLYTYIRRSADKYKRKLYFTDTGLARLTSIEGYLAALAETGHKLATPMAEDFYRNLDRVVQDHDVEFVVRGTGTDKERTVKVPSRKCLIGDDGTKHGFSLLWLFPVDPEVYDDRIKHHREGIRREDEEFEKAHPSCKKCGHQEYRWSETSHELTVKDLKIFERVDPHAQYSEEITEFRFVNGMQVRIYYRVGMNGGMIYHGPGAGQTFTTNIGNQFWGIHT